MNHISNLAAEHSAAATDERARDRAGAWVPDDWRRPTEAELEPSEPETSGWWCRHCKTSHRDGDPFDGCKVCGHVIGAAS